MQQGIRNPFNCYSRPNYLFFRWMLFPYFAIIGGTIVIASIATSLQLETVGRIVMLIFNAAFVILMLFVFRRNISHYIHWTEWEEDVADKKKKNRKETKAPTART